MRASFNCPGACDICAPRACPQSVLVKIETAERTFIEFPDGAQLWVPANTIQDRTP